MPQLLPKGQSLNMYTRKELTEALERYCQDKKQFRRLEQAAARIWLKDRGQDLLQAAIAKILAADASSLSKEVPLRRTLIRNMRWVARDWLKSVDALGPTAQKNTTPFEDLTALVARSPHPDDRILYQQMMTRVLERAREIEKNQHAGGKEKVLPLNDYLKLRFEQDLEGDELRKTLGLSDKDFKSITKAACRLVSKVSEESRA